MSGRSRERQLRMEISTGRGQRGPIALQTNVSDGVLEIHDLTAGQVSGGTNLGGNCCANAGPTTDLCP